MRVIAPSNDVFSIGKVLSKFSLDNESTLWAEAWLREVFLFQNSGYITKIADSKKFDYVINTTNTIPIKCDLWWIQGVSASTAMESMAFRKNWQRAFARMIELGLRTPSINIINRLNSKSDLRVANSNYIKNYYHNIGIAVDGVVHSFPDVSSFKKEDTRTGEKYVFGYVGKETEVDTLLRLTGENIKLITFGQKNVPGVSDKLTNKKINFLGRVTHEQLNSLYSSAQFTVFPFTNEPLGAIPIESMACGTPVLTYNKQGPSETVINEETGWLANDAEEFVEIGIKLWKGFDREKFSKNSIRRASQFTPDRQATKIIEFLMNS